MINEKLVRIGIEGAPSVGKTTATAIVSGIMLGSPNIAVVGEVARTFFDTHPQITGRGPDVQKQILDAVREAEDVVAQTGVEVMLCDRTTLSPSVHAAAAGETAAAEMLWEIGKPEERYNEILVFSPKGVPYEPDPLRQQTHGERIHLHTTYLRILEERGMPYHVVTGGAAARVITVFNTIFKYTESRVLFPGVEAIPALYKR